MKKILFSTLTIATLLLTNETKAQNQIISFEENEGYVLGNVINQNQWSTFGYLFEGFANVIDNDSSNGQRAVQVNANAEEEENWGGLVYPLSTMNKFIISADVKFSGDMGSDYDMLSLYSEIDNEFEYVSGFYFQYTGETSFGNETSTVSPFEWTANTWYNLKSEVDFETRQVKLFVNNSLVHTVSIPNEIDSVSEVDFEFDNYETGFTLDNVQIINLENLGIEETLLTEYSIYPNPTSDIIHVKSKEAIKILEIIDFTGKSLAKNNDSNSIDVQHLPKGIYLIKIITEKGTNVQKFIKK